MTAFASRAWPWSRGARCRALPRPSAPTHSRSQAARARGQASPACAWLSGLASTHEHGAQVWEAARAVTAQLPRRLLVEPVDECPYRRAAHLGQPAGPQQEAGHGVVVRPAFPGLEMDAE